MRLDLNDTILLHHKIFKSCAMCHGYYDLSFLTTVKKPWHQFYGYSHARHRSVKELWLKDAFIIVHFTSSPRTTRTERRATMNVIHILVHDRIVSIRSITPGFRGQTNNYDTYFPSTFWLHSSGSSLLNSTWKGMLKWFALTPWLHFSTWRDKHFLIESNTGLFCNIVES